MTQLAIIGMDAKFSGLDNIDQVERAFYQGKLIANQLSALIEQTPLSKQINQSLTILAQQVNGDAAQLTLVLLGKGDNELLDSTLVDSSEINAKSVVTSANLADALAKIVTLTKKGEMVALIAVHQVRVYDKNSGNMSDGNMSFGADFSQYQPCSGLASLLFGANNASTSSSASHSGAHYVYGVVKGFASGSDIKNTARQAMINSGVTSSDIALLEVSALGDATYSEQESHALMNAYNEGSDNPLQTAISSARCISGEAGNLSQLLGLIKTVICLQQRYLPGNAVWQAPHEHALQAWQQSAFYFPVDSRPWYPNKDGSPHCAAYSCLSVDSRLSVNQQGRTDYCHIILQESVIEEPGQRHPLSDIRRNGYFANSDCVITVLRGVSESQLQDALQRVAQLCQSMSLKDIAKQCYRDFDETKSYAGSYQIALLAESVADLLSEIKQATTGISLAFEKNSDWKTPKGSYFTSVPAQQGQQDGVTFLYPGIGATYVGLGRDLFHLFPEIYQPVANLADDIGASLKDTLLNPRSIVAHSFNELKQLDLELRGNLANIAEAGVGFACVFTTVFEEVFAVKANFATGYSMGEVSMYAALGCWQQPGLMSARLAQSDTFNHQLCGELRTLRQHWDLPNATKDLSQPIWETYTIKATIEQVELAAINESRVYCTIINTPDNLLLAGYPQDCLKVIKTLGVRAMPLNMANAIHSAPAYSEYDNMVELYTMDVKARISTKMYSSSCYLPIPQLSKAIAHSIAKCLCDVVDFPRLINTLSDKGANVFIEMGPGRSLCAWVDKIISHQHKKNAQSEINSLEHTNNSLEHIKYSHVSVPVNAKGTSDELTYLRAVAKLISHGVTLNLDTLFNGSIIVKQR